MVHDRDSQKGQFWQVVNVYSKGARENGEF